MKKLVLVSALALLFSFNAGAFEVNPYVSGKVNINFQDYDLDEEISFKDTVFGGSIAAGISGSRELPLRTEFEFSMASKAKDSFLGILDVSAKINSYMINFYYDFYNESNFVPYLEVGLGASTAKATLAINDDEGVYSDSEKETKFSWQAGFGSYYKISENISTDLGVKYSKTSFGDLDIDVDLITVSLGLRYDF